MGHRRTCFVLILLVLTATTLGIARIQNSRLQNGNGRDPQPEDALPAIIAAFDRFPVVAISDVHGIRDVNDFVMALVRHPGFPDAVNDIVVEFANSELQPMLDRYIAGDEVPVADARRLWRDESAPDYWDLSGFHAQLLQLVRRINQKLPPAKRLRVLSGEPTIDRQVSQPDQWRDIHIASVIENEVLAKNRKALMFYGGGHLLHGTNNYAVSRYEQKYPGISFVVFLWIGRTQRDRCGLPVNLSPSAESQMASWRVPSLVRTDGTWLSDINSGTSQGVKKGGGTFDAYLYLGPPGLLLSEGNALQVREQDSNLLRCEAGQ
jgi:hypothetical protein